MRSDISLPNGGQAFVDFVGVDLPAPSLKDNTADLDRLARALAQKGYSELRIRPADMDRLVRKIRQQGLSFRAVVGYAGSFREILDIVPHDSDAPLLGFSIDLGTTSLVFRLIDMTGRIIVAERSVRNPQIDLGEDILTRIMFARIRRGSKPFKRCSFQHVRKP